MRRGGEREKLNVAAAAAAGHNRNGESVLWKSSAIFRGGQFIFPTRARPYLNSGENNIALIKPTVASVQSGHGGGKITHMEKFMWQIKFGGNAAIQRAER